ncbi:MAG TPA: BrnT family toxin [Burkholderiaceae bacterium]|nr:BrnT family toxin [Burkholderiaceae bacterium]
MQIEFDSDKRGKTLAERGLDFARAAEVFANALVNVPDTRFEYGEKRFNTVGTLDGRMVVVAWTPRGEVRRIISMRKANEREQWRYTQQHLG